MTLEKASKLDMIRSFGKLSLTKIIEEKYPTIGMLERQYDKEKVEKVIKVLIYDLSSSFNDILDEDEVEETVIEITSSLLRNLSLEDIFYVCRKIKYTDIWGKRLTVNKVLAEFEKHMDAKINKTYEKNYNKHLSEKFVDNEALDITKEVNAHMKAQTYYDMNKDKLEKDSKKWNEKVDKGSKKKDKG